jgi:hypothetical protein
LLKIRSLSLENKKERLGIIKCVKIGTSRSSHGRDWDLNSSLVSRDGVWSNIIVLNGGGGKERKKLFLNWALIID